MIDYRGLERRLHAGLDLQRRPVAVAFRETAPAGVPKFGGTEPSGCSFWRLAMDGRAFSTTPGDHVNGPIGSYTHNIPLPAERAHELEQTLGLMTEIGYLRMEEVPGIPRLPRTPASWSTRRWGRRQSIPTSCCSRDGPGGSCSCRRPLCGPAWAPACPCWAPTCMALPAALAQGAMASSACIGNRVYTEIGDDELYVVVPGRDLPRVADEVRGITEANRKLTDYHRERRRTLATE